MKNFANFIAICCILNPFCIGYAQFNFKKTVEKAFERKIEEKTNETIDKEVDKAISKKQNKNAETNTDNTTKTNEVKIGGGKIETKDVIIEEGSAPTSPVKASTFIGSFTMEMIPLKEGIENKNKSVEINYNIKEYLVAVVSNFEKGKNKMKMRSIFDRKENTVIIISDELDDEQKNGMKMRVPKITSKSNNKDEKDNKFTKTNETKNIMGYTCTKYINKTADATMFFWVTEVLDLNLSEIYGFSNNSGKKGNTNFYDNIKGTALEVNIRANNGKDGDMNVYIRDIKKGIVDENAFSTMGYNIIDIKTNNNNIREIEKD